MKAGKWLLIGGGIITKSAVFAGVVGRRRENAKAETILNNLLKKTAQAADTSVDLSSIADLPAPVARYFRQALTPGQNLIRSAEIQQSGELRTSTDKQTWSRFAAIHTLAPPACGFLWDAKVEMPLSTHMRVLDSYDAGIASSRVSFLSAVLVDSEEGTPEQNSGALHRYLAEAVWSPTALLPQSGVVWTPINDWSALATLSNGSIAVSLEFRFNDAGEIASVYSPGRYGRIGGRFKLMPWEGHFRGYQNHAGMRVPAYGEVGWYVDGALELVWKGHIVDIEYTLGSQGKH